MELLGSLLYALFNNKYIIQEASFLGLHPLFKLSGFRLLVSPASFILISVVIASSCALLSACQSDSWKNSEAEAVRLSATSDLEGSIKMRILALKQMSSSNANLENRELELEMYKSLIRQLNKAGRTAESAEFADKAVIAAEHLYGPDDPRILPQVAVAHQVALDKTKSAALLSRMIDLQGKVSGLDSVPVMYLLASYVRSVSSACAETLDVNKLRHLVRLRDKFSKPSSYDAQRDRLTLADSLSNINPPEAYSIYEKCISVARSDCPTSLPDALYRYAKVLDRKKLYARSLPLLKEAFVLTGPGKTFQELLSPQIATEYGFALEALKLKSQAAAVYGSMAKHYESLGKANNPYYEQFSERQKQCTVS